MCVFAYDHDMYVHVFVCLCVLVWAFTHAEFVCIGMGIHTR